MILSLVVAVCQEAAVSESDYYRVDMLQPPAGEFIEVGGLDFDSSGTLYVSTRRGRVWRVENPLATHPAEARWSIWAEGLHSGLGLRVVEDEVYLVQRGELSRLRDVDGDGIVDDVDTITQGWGMSGNYHEFAFGLPRDPQGNFYISTNVGFWSPEWWHGLSKVPWRGWIIKLSPDGEAHPYASGVRSPCGLGFGPDGDLFYTDNQGDWMPACGVFHVEEGDFFSHPASLRWTDAYGNGDRIPSSMEAPNAARKPAAIWIPYEWSRSTGNLMMVDSAGKFGPFDGQMIAAELTNGMLVRLQMEKVQGQWQGACFPFRRELGSAVRVRFASDGTLFVGYTNRGWGGRAPGDGLARVRWTGIVPQEMQTVHLLQDGFEIALTKPVAPALTIDEVKIRDYDYNWWWDYGSPEMRERSLEVLSATLSEDRQRLLLKVSGLHAGRCVRGTISGLGLLHDTFDYTINQMPKGPWNTDPVVKLVAPPPERENESEGWLHLTWGDALALWEGQGWKLCEVRPDPEDPKNFLSGLGNSALANVGPNAGDLVSTLEFGDIEFRFNVQLPEGGDSGLYFQSRYELQLVDDADQCGGIWEVKNPRVRGWRGPHDWHTVTGRFLAPRFDAAGRRTRRARFEEIAVDGVVVVPYAECDGPTGGGEEGEVARGPLRFQGWLSPVAIADVRVLPLDAKTDTDGWQHFGSPLLLDEYPSQFDWHARLRIGEGEAGLRVGDFSVRINAMGPSRARTGSVLPGHPLGVELIPADTWFDLDLQRRGPRLLVVLNGVTIQTVDLGSVEPLPVVLKWAPDTLLEVEDARWLHWQGQE